MAKNNFKWSNQMRKLHGRFERTKRKMGEATFDEVLIKMDLSAKDKKQLFATKTSLFSERGEDEESSLYLIENKEDTKLDADQADAVRNAKLNDWERAVLNAFLIGGCGWQKKVAEKFGKSKTLPKLTLESVKKKILQEYKKVA